MRALLAALVALTSVAVGSVSDSSPQLLFLDPSPRDRLVSNSYLVKLKDGTSQSAATDHLEWIQRLHASQVSSHVDLRRRQTPSEDDGAFRGLTNTFEVEDEFKGYAVHVSSYIAEEIRDHPDVEFIEHEPMMYASSPDFFAESSQEHPPWGLGRISHQNHENTSWPYTYAGVGLGAGVDVYVLDTGIFAEHEDFEGRIAQGVSVVPGEDTVNDVFGHGTHCAGTIAGKKFGVAKQATIVPVKVLGTNGAGGAALLAKGMEWATKRHLQRTKAGDNTFRGSVFSMSLGGSRSELVNKFASRIAAYGVHLIAAAGNEVTTVGAIDYKENFAIFSNWGSCVDINAPGVAIRSAGLHNKTGEDIKSGSSMACPHVAGVVASLLSRQPVDTESGRLKASTPITALQLRADLLKITTKGVLNETSLPINTTDRIVYSGGARKSYEDVLDHGGWPECCQ